MPIGRQWQKWEHDMTDAQFKEVKKLCRRAAIVFRSAAVEKLEKNASDKRRFHVDLNRLRSLKCHH